MLILLTVIYTSTQCIYGIIKDFVYIYILPKLRKRCFVDEQEGAWAIITGAGDGLGKAYAMSLGKRKMKCCLIGRTLSKLEDVSRHLKTEYNVEVKVIPYNFNESTPDTELEFEKQLKPILPHTTILINNVGTAGTSNECWTKPWIDFDSPKSSIAFAREILKVNVDSAIFMSALVSPYMKKNRKGALLFVSSIAACYPMYTTSVYCASKSCLSFLADGLAQVLCKDNIHVLVYEPLYIKTKLISQNIRQNWPTWMALPPELCAEQSLQDIGTRVQAHGRFEHCVQAHVLKSLAHGCPRRFTNALFKNFSRAISSYDQHSKND